MEYGFMRGVLSTHVYLAVHVCCFSVFNPFREIASTAGCGVVRAKKRRIRRNSAGDGLGAHPSCCQGTAILTICSPPTPRGERT